MEEKWPKSIGTESRLVVARGWGGRWGQELGLTANRYRVSSWGDGNVLELVVMVAHTVNILKANELHFPVVKCYVM